VSDYLDRFGRGQSICHRWPPLARLVAAIGMILSATCVPFTHPPLVGIVACVIFFAHTLARIPLAYVVRRLLLFWPPLFLMAISLPLSQAGQKGWPLFVTILVRGTLSFSTALWLVNVMPFDQLLATLRRLRVPDVLLAILSLMYRFLFVLWDELDRMRTARASRLFRKPSLLATWRSAAHLVGRLLIRALDRADRIHGAMLARGWDGRSRWIEQTREDRP
jgi:cobalt/nickel transport system permease protein